MHTVMNKAKKGMALVIVLIIFALISVIGTTVLTISVSQANQTTHGISYDKAYYLARSGVEVVAKDLQERFAELSYLQSQIAAATNEEEFTDRLNKYIFELSFINNNIINHTVTLTNTDGYVSDQVQISNVGNIVYIESVKDMEGATAKAKVYFARHSSISDSVILDVPTEVTVTTGNDAFYTWGNLVVMNNSEIYGNISHTGTAEFKKTPDVIGTNSTVAAYPIHHQVPPTSIWNDTMTSPQDLAASGTISTSGYYKASYGNQAFHWVVDTSANDVILVFNSISSEKASSILVTGPHNLYIYLLQEDDPTKPLIYIKNDLSIINQNTSDTTPHTYIISYDKKMRDASYMGENSKVEIKNCPEMQAYFYLPYTDVVIKNNLTMTGCMYAGNIDIKNNLGVTYAAPADANFGANHITERTETVITPVTHNYNYVEYVVNKKWIK